MKKRACVAFNAMANPFPMNIQHVQSRHRSLPASGRENAGCNEVSFGLIIISCRL